MNSNQNIIVSYTIDPSASSTLDRTKLSEKIMKKNEQVYKILCNDSNYITMDDHVIRYYRSVVLDENEKPLCFSPQTSISMDLFTESISSTDDLFVNEIVEGTMINLFYDERIQSWEIATRGSIGGRYWYYRTQYIINQDDAASKPLSAHPTPQMTFRNMLMDALRMDPAEDSLNSSAIVAELPKEYCYSFVLQHPANHIVLNIGEPRLYLVAVYSLANRSQNRIEYLSPVVYEEWTCFKGLHQCIQFPRRFHSWNGSSASIKEMVEGLTSQHCSTQSDYHLVGLMLSNLRTGERTPISNPAYEELKKIRGNNPNLQYQYFCLLRIGQTARFLEYFPSYKKLFREFQRQYQDLITNVHQSYFSYYIQPKMNRVSEGADHRPPIAKKFFIHVSKIHHDIYLPSLKEENKIIIKRSVVAEYFDKMTPVELLYYLNYDRRQAAKERRKIQKESAGSDGIEEEIGDLVE
jgi:hypothetical protein